MFMSLIQRRRSIRKFQRKSVEAAKLNLLVEAALRAPSSRGLNPWEFIVVIAQDTLQKLSEAKPHGAEFLKGAPLGIVVCAHTERSDVWIEDTSIAATFIQLAAESLGLGSCWIQIRERMYSSSTSAQEYIAELLHIPANMRVESIIALGYPDEEIPPHGREELEYDKVHLGLYGRLYRTDGDHLTSRDGER